MKTYTCACGWKAEDETLDGLIAKVREHGEQQHIEVEVDVEKICKYLEKKYAE